MTTRRLHKGVSLAMCAALLAPLPGLAAEPLSRLFLTPAERAGLERLRLQNGVISTVQFNEIGFSEQVTLEGYARHSSGKATAWVNTDGAEAAQMVGARRRGQPALVALRQADGKRIALKVGQTYHKTSNSVREQFEAAPVEPELVQAK